MQNNTLNKSNHDNEHDDEPRGAAQVGQRAPKRAMSASAQSRQRSRHDQFLGNLPPLPHHYFNRQHSVPLTPSTAYATPLATPVSLSSFSDPDIAATNRKTTQHIPPMTQMALYLPEKSVQKLSQPELSNVQKERLLTEQQFYKSISNVSPVIKTSNLSIDVKSARHESLPLTAKQTNRLVRRRSIHHQRHTSWRNTPSEVCN
jgi:hypothetical protein